jgi:hypothetical protein
MADSIFHGRAIVVKQSYLSSPWKIYTPLPDDTQVALFKYSQNIK